MQQKSGRGIMESSSADHLSVVGKPVPVKDAREKVTGKLKYAVDFDLPNMGYGKILRSPHPHARIKSIEYSRAEQLPGVLGVVTHEDAPDNDWESCWFNYRGHIFDGTARFVGDEVAAIAAVDETIAEEALKLIEVDYEILPAVFDPEDALAPNAPQVRAEGNVREPDIVQWGDLEQGFEDADVVVESSVEFGSQQYAPIGRNACIAEWSGDRITVWTSSQTPSELRNAIAQAFGISISKVRVIALPCGCSFGLWWINNFHMVTILLAKKVGQPVKIELSNHECFTSVKRRHRERSRGKIGCKKDGSIVLLDITHYADNGGYGFKTDVGGLMCDLWGRGPHGRFEIQIASTNLVTAGCMRGVGDVTLGSFTERLADMAAEKLGINPLAFRLKNLVRKGDTLRKVAEALAEARIPEETKKNWPELGVLAGEGLHDCLVKGAERFRWKERWKGWGIPLSTEGEKHRAVGLGTGIHSCGVELEGNTSAIVRVHADGSVTLCTSMGRQGQGSETTQAQIVSESLGIPVDDVEVEAGDTEACPFNHGSIASNTAFRVGFATREACLDARRQILEIAAKYYLECNPEQLDIKDGIISFSENVKRSISLKRLMTELLPDHYTPPSIVGRPNKTMPPTITFTRQFGAHFVEVEVDTGTGRISLTDYLATQDSGTVLNPAVLENQVLGGATVGAGFAMTETLVFDQSSGKILNGNFLDYKVLRAPDFPLKPDVMFCGVPDPVGPFGAKGAGESNIAAAVPAIAQAVYNAIGVWIDMPMTPEKVLRAFGRI